MAEIQNLTMLREQLCIDFINTVDYNRSIEKNIEKEYLTSYSAFIQFCQKTEIIDSKQTAFFLEEGREKSIEAAKVMKRVIELREAVFRILLAVINEDTPNQKDLDILNIEIERLLPFSKLKYIDNKFAWERTSETKNLDWPLSIIINDITELLTSKKLERLKICSHDKCCWMFLDMSKNKSRRWCSMKDCGNRAKARRHYYNKKIKNTE